MLIRDIQLQLENTSFQSLGVSESMAGPSIMNDEKYEINEGVLFAVPLQIESVMTFSTKDKKEKKEFKYDICSPVILSTKDQMLLCLTGKWSMEVFSIPQIATLFSFLDFQAKRYSNPLDKSRDISDSVVIMHTERNLAITAASESKTFIRMVIYALLNSQTSQLDSLFSFIRGVESYWVSYFLLSQVMNKYNENDEYKIYNASKKYGVSESYFRRLCHHAFTRGPKKQLRIWRAAHSALQLIDRDSSIATIAGNNGYSSSSHFSSEIKSLFGITPRVFKKLGTLIHE